ncbi:hypothetical protein FACS1894166_02960 [Bacilli bacterium]|nr:hypothetical protein FACS1894166_02960 [Bacilli bacterium]
MLAGIEYEWVDTQNKFSSSQRHPENIIGVDEVYGSDSDYITSRSENSLRLTPIIDLISKKVIQYCF